MTSSQRVSGDGRDLGTVAQSLKPVLRTMVHQVTELIHVRVATDTITATPNHPFRVAGRGWVAAGELAAGDTLYLADGGRADVVSVTREKLATPVDVYNVEVSLSTPDHLARRSCAV